MYRADFGEHGIATPFVGRENELAHLAEAIELGTTGRTIVVQGAPGSGKTRLAQELAARMTERGIRVLWGHWCEDDADRLPRRFIVLGDERRDGARGVLFSDAVIGSSDLPRLSSRLQKWIWSIGSMPPRWRVPPAGVVSSDANEETCVPPTCTDDRLLLILDNLRTRDRLSLIFFRTLARNLRPIPGLLLGIFDDRQAFDCTDFETALGSLVGLSDRITLRGLADREVARMVQLTAGDRVRPEALSEIQTVSRGSPRTVAIMANLFCTRQVDRTDDRLACVPEVDARSPMVVRFHTAHDISGTEKNLFAREGDYWTLLFRGNVARLRHIKGFTYIASLLREPYRQLHVLELAALEQRSDRVADGHSDFRDTSPSSLRIGFQRDTGPVLDWRAKEDYARRLRELDEEIREATAFNDLGKIARFQQERAFITEEVVRAIGLCGRDRRGVSTAERARVSVTHAIKSGIRKIARCQPDLGRHLNIAIRTGLYCTYLPEEVTQRSLGEQ